ncbi:MAG: hypothetical protein AB7V08_08380 [Elusimicrobiales bacterium]
MKLLTALLLALAPVLYAGEYDFAIPGSSGENAAPKLELGGNLDARYSLVDTRRTSPLYALQYYGQAPAGTLSQYRLDLYFNGDYRSGATAFHARTYAQYYSEAESDLSLHELYGTLALGERATLTAGKRMYSWGKGYAFNPVGYVNPVKDPENPELAQAGLMSFGYEYIRSFSGGALNNAAFNLIAVPSAETLTAQNSEARDTDLAAKLSLLAWDTDIDFMAYASRVNPERAGTAASRNLGPSLEVHGEYSRFYNKERYTIAAGAASSSERDGEDWLLGLRWLNSWNLTAIAEYYRSGAGLTREEYRDYAGFLDAAAVSGSSVTAASALAVSRGYFGSSNLMKDYIYLKLSWPEPFNWLYFTPSAYVMINAADGSWLAGLPLSYKPVTNFEFIAWPVFTGGGRSTEFGGRQASAKLDLWLRFYF